MKKKNKKNYKKLEITYEYEPLENTEERLEKIFEFYPDRTSAITVDKNES